jgi:hypothetical protein
MAGTPRSIFSHPSMPFIQDKILSSRHTDQRLLLYKKAFELTNKGLTFYQTNNLNDAIDSFSKALSKLQNIRNIFTNKNFQNELLRLKAVLHNLRGNAYAQRSSQHLKAIATHTGRSYIDGKTSDKAFLAKKEKDATRDSKMAMKDFAKRSEYSQDVPNARFETLLTAYGFIPQYKQMN